jgi:hypothetical protein
MNLSKHLSFRYKGPLLFLFCPLLLSAAEKAQTMIIVADSRKLQGLRLWWANLYNDNHLHFALMTVILIPLAGGLLGVVADQVMSHIGIDLKSRNLREG